MSLSFAVTVTEPALVVEPAAIVSVVALDSAKSAAIAPAPAAADTVTVTATLDVRSSRAVTVATPPFSEIEDEDSTSVVCGASSSVIVSVALDGAATPLPPAAVADTATCLLPDATVLSFAVIVTEPALVVEPAAMVNVFALDSAKSAAIAPAPATADTVTVTRLARRAVQRRRHRRDPASLRDRRRRQRQRHRRQRLVVGQRQRRPGHRPQRPGRWVSVAVTVVERPPLPWCVSSSTAAIAAVSVAFAVSPAAITMVASEPTV